LASRLLAIPGNDRCAECGTHTSLDWASVNLGIVICIVCSSFHRGLGRHISRVKSILLDKWDLQEVQLMEAVG
ncbi:hypothetical protein CXG81DRAFT_1139, partial [Caulochytrium protostelioides]